MTYKVTATQTAQIHALQNYHGVTCAPIHWHKESKEPFREGEIGPHEHRWNSARKTYAPNLFARMLGIQHGKRTYMKWKEKQGRKMDKVLYRQWEENYPFVQQMIQGDEEAWRQAVREHATFPTRTRLLQGYSLHKYDEKTVECDVFMYPLDNVVPTKLQKITKKGHIRYHEFPKTKRVDVYQSHVYSGLLYIVNELFAVLPCDTVYINALVGDRYDHYPIFSTVMERHYYRDRISPQAAFKNHRHMVSFKKRSGFEPVNRVYSPTVFQPKGE